MLKLKDKQGSHFVFRPLSAKELQEATEMMTKSFLETNSIWIKLGITHEEALDYNAYRMQKGLDSELTFVPSP